MASLYDQTVPTLIKYLNNFAGLLKKGEEYAAKEESTEDIPSKEKLLTFRLREDMRPLTYQVQSCSNTAKFLVSRLAGGEDTVLEDNETTFEELHARIQRTIEILKTIDAEAFNKDWDQEFTMSTRAMGSYKFASKQTYVSEYVMPNFYFHMATGYCILRNLGVPVGAFDFMAGVFHKVEA